MTQLKLIFLPQFERLRCLLRFFNQTGHNLVAFATQNEAIAEKLFAHFKLLLLHLFVKLIKQAKLFENCDQFIRIIKFPSHFFLSLFEGIDDARADR
ncbi:hypothetical protein C9I56_23335 [Paraburkholderia caribensis]|nr:hypothetical protein C9I56_23335 [Paraburkholderia caribensis]